MNTHPYICILYVDIQTPSTFEGAVLYTFIAPALKGMAPLLHPLSTMVHKDVYIVVYKAGPVGPLYRARRGMLGAKRRRSWLQAAHNTD